MNNELIVLVKKWFDKVNGNTYHSVQFDINDKIYHSGRVYGYERQYEQTFKDLYENEYLDYAMHYNDKLIAMNPNYKEIINPKYIVIEDCKKKELDTIHEYK